MVVLGAIIVAVHWRVNFSPGLLWALSIWGLLHMAGGLVQVPAGWPTDGEHGVLYSLWLIPGYLKYNNPIHAYGFAVSTWACWQSLRAAVPTIRPSFGILTLCALGGMGLGAANEIIEFMATVLISGDQCRRLREHRLGPCCQLRRVDGCSHAHWNVGTQSLMLRPLFRV